MSPSGANRRLDLVVAAVAKLRPEATELPLFAAALGLAGIDAGAVRMIAPDSAPQPARRTDAPPATPEPAGHAPPSALPLRSRLYELPAATPGADAPPWAPKAPPPVLHGHDGAVLDCAASPDGRLAASAGADGTVRLWDLDTGRLIAVFRGHDAPVLTCGFLPGGQQLLSVDTAGSGKRWELGSGRQTIAWTAHETPLRGCVLSPDGRLLAAMTDRFDLAYDLRSGDEVATLSSAGTTAACAFSHDGRWLATTHREERTVWLWDTESWAAQAGASRISAGAACCFSPDGLLLAVSQGDRISFRDISSDRSQLRAAVTTPDIPDGSLAKSCVFSPDARFLAVACNEGDLYLWDLRAGAWRGHFAGHVGPVHRCVFVQSGRLLLSAGQDGTLRLWDVAGGQALPDPDAGPDPMPLGRAPVAPPPVTPLLPRRTARGVMAALLSRRAPVGRFDLPRIADRVARGETLARLPRRRHFALPHALAVVADLGPTLDPFRDDLPPLLDALRAALGAGRIAWTPCDGAPPEIVARGAMGLDPEDHPLRLPPAGTPVLLVTDLGLTPLEVRPLPMRAGRRAWLGFAARLRAARCLPVALAPLSEREIAAARLPRFLPVLSWDALATARAARRLVERAWPPA